MSFSLLLNNPSPIREAAQQSQQKRIPKGVITGSIPLDAAKAYPLRYFLERELTPRIAYADANTHNETNTLNIKYIPNGSARTPHPQIVFYINGPYHLERLKTKKLTREESNFFGRK